jgi:hypothetical protein
MDKNYHATQTGKLPQIATIIISLVSTFFLKKATPHNASGLMSMLPSGLTDAFSDDEKTEFTTKQENVSQQDVLQDLAKRCFNGKTAQAQRAFQEVTKLINEQTVKQGQGIIQETLGNSAQGQVYPFCMPDPGFVRTLFRHGQEYSKFIQSLLSSELLN